MTSTKDLIAGLNQDLAAEWGTIMRYAYQSSKAFGLGGAEFREILEKEIQDELGHATYLMDVIVDLGGEPTTTPKDFDKPEGIREMIALDLKMEEQDVKDYAQRAQQAEELGEIELKVTLEDMAADEAGHARELKRLLKGLKS